MSRGPGSHEPRILARAQQDGQITITTARNAIATQDPPTPSERGMGTRFLKKLVKEGWLEPAGDGVWVPTEKGRSGPYLRRGQRAPYVPTVSHEATTNLPAAEDPLREPAAPEPSPVAPVAVLSDVDRVRALMDRADAIRAAGGEVPAELDEALRLSRAVHGADDWRLAVPAMFPSVCRAPFAPHHEELLEWADAIEEGSTPRPFVAIWNRGAAKSSIAELICVWLAHKRVRKYALYVSGKQAKADDHVQSIADLLESDEIASIDADLSERRIGKYGASKGWRRNRLTTKSGFTVDAVGLDSDVRGARIGTQRPDLLIFDDIDGVADSLATIDKKIARLTKDLIPTRSPEGVAMMFVQNIIHGQSIAARLAEIEGAPEIDFMARRIVSGPIKAVDGLEVREEYDEEIDRNRMIIVGGTPTWVGYDIPACQDMVDDEGLTAFLSECQHEYGTLKGGMFDHIDFSIRRRTRAELPALNGNATWKGPCGTWVDPAVTSTDRSDSCAVMTDGLGPDKKYWRLYSWEQVTSPEEAMRNGLESAMRWGSQVLGVETDQGGDTWEVVYRTVVKTQLDDPDSYTYRRHFEDNVPIPKYEQRKAGAAEGSPSKRQRIAQMLARYDTDEFRHFDEGCRTLEAGLSRFPKYKPFDICDAAWHSWRHLAEHGGERSNTFRVRASRGSIGDTRPAY